MEFVMFLPTSTRCPRPLFTLLLGAVVSLGAACTSDQSKRDDAGDVSDVSDSGAAGDGEAGAEGAEGADADAGADDIPVVADQVDAGHIGDGSDGDEVDGHATANGTGVEGIPGSGPKVDPIQVTIFNRILAKANDNTLNPGQVQALAEGATKATVLRVRRTAATFWLIEFAPTSPPRKAADQAALIAALKKVGSFKIVEGDQVMTIKQPSGARGKLKTGFGVKGGAPQ